MRSITWAAVVVVATSGCVYHNPVGSPFDRSASMSTSLTVSNDHPVDVRISVMQGSVAIPLGRVGGLTSTHLRLSPSQLSNVGPIRFEIQESASALRVTTLPVLAGPGHPIHLRVNHGLDRSAATVQ